MREVCNLGYGRHSCDQFPAQSAADAIRFHVASDAGELIKIQYVFEKDCWPGEHGEVNLATAPTTLRRQAEVFVQSYVRRRDQT
jgi:hypothetical protein